MAIKNYCKTKNKNGVILYWEITSEGNLKRVAKSSIKDLRSVKECASKSQRKRQASRSAIRSFFQPRKSKKFCKTKDRNGKDLYWEIDERGKRFRRKKEYVLSVQSSVKYCN